MVQGKCVSNYEVKNKNKTGRPVVFCQNLFPFIIAFPPELNSEAACSSYVANRVFATAVLALIPFEYNQGRKSISLHFAQHIVHKKMETGVPKKVVL